MIYIAIVDGGVNKLHPNFKNDEINIVNAKHESNHLGHGTAIYNIIRKVRSYANIINFQVSDKNGDITEQCLMVFLILFFTHGGII